MDPTEQPVSSVMQTEYVSVKPGDHLDFVDDVMKLGRIRHMPVIDDDKLVGVVSQRDLLAASLSRALEFEPDHRRSFMRAVDVSEVMSKSPIAIATDATLREAARLIITHKIGCLPVVDEAGSVVGLVTETDLLVGVYGLGEVS